MLSSEYIKKRDISEQVSKYPLFIFFYPVE